MTSVKKVEFEKVEEIIALSKDWHALSGSLFAAKVDPQKTKGFFKSSRAAGRDYVAIDIANRDIVLTDYMKGVENFKAVTADDVKAAAGLLEEEEEPAAKKAVAVKKPAQKPAKKTATKKTSQEKPAAATVKESVKKPAKKAAALQVIKPAPKEPAGLQFGPALVEDKNGKATIASLLHAGKEHASRCLPADFSARFKKYSDDNQLLLYLQGGPGLGQVSTYRGWLKQGRQVSKGQHGLKILAPRMVTKEDGQKAIDGLRLVTLFSVDQTEAIKEA